jgi:hypothetical protein
MLAECAFCSTALPLQENYRVGAGSSPIVRGPRTSYAELNAA